MLCVQRLSDAGGQGQVLASTMPRGQNRAAKGSFYYEDDPLCPSRYIIDLWPDFS